MPKGVEARVAQKSEVEEVEEVLSRRMRGVAFVGHLLSNALLSIASHQQHSTARSLQLHHCTTWMLPPNGFQSQSRTIVAT